MIVNEEKNLVLVVEDNYLNRFILSKTLDELNQPHYECEDGLEAITWLKGTSSKNITVFLDLNMPVMDGYDFLEYLDKNPTEFKHINMQVYILSASTLSEFSVNMPDANIAGFLNKPVDIRHIKQVLESSRQIFTY